MPAAAVASVVQARASQISSHRTFSRPANAFTRTHARRMSVVVRAEDYKEPGSKYPAWISIQKELAQKYKLRSVTPDEAAIMIDGGKAVLLDVRLAEDFAESHPKGSVKAPAFRVIKMRDGAGFNRMLKGLLMQANGVTPTEPSPNFPAEAAAAAGSGKAVILACEAGGTTAATSSFPNGKASRSLKAAWKLCHMGVIPAERVLHLDGGVLGWFRTGLPMEGDKDYNSSKAGRTPNVVSSGVKK